MKNVNIHMLGAYSKNTELDFNNKAGRNSAIADSGVKTRVMATDSLLCGKSVSYIKADVEGADVEVILGMKNTLKILSRSSISQRITVLKIFSGCRS